MQWPVRAPEIDLPLSREEVRAALREEREREQLRLEDLRELHVLLAVRALLRREEVLSSRGSLLLPDRALEKKEEDEDLFEGPLPARLRELTDGELPRVPVAAARAFLENLLERASVAFVDLGPSSVLEDLRSTLGFRRDEALALLRLVRDRLREDQDASLEDRRALLATRLEQTRAESREVGDRRSELTTMRHLAGVWGLTRDEPQDQGYRDLVDVVARASREEDQPVKPR